jgi:hypothetical protein
MHMSITRMGMGMDTIATMDMITMATVIMTMISMKITMHLTDMHQYLLVNPKSITILIYDPPISTS